MSRSARLAANNFDLLRLGFAAMVVVSHTSELSGLGSLEGLQHLVSSPVAIRGFFVLSGFLIFMSAERSTSLWSYATKRIRRIYPAYATVVLLCAFGLVFVSDARYASYFFSLQWAKYVLANLVFLNFLGDDLPGVFQRNLVPTVNGALWTIKVEVAFYVAVPFLVHLLRRFGRLRVLTLFYLMSVAYHLVLTRLAERTGSHAFLELEKQMPGQLRYFLAGAAIYYYLPTFERRIRSILATAVAVLILDSVVSLPLVEPLAFGAVIVFLGLYWYLGNFGKYGDFSYGTYILHFPVLQLLIWSGWLRTQPWLFLTAELAATAALAFCMWHLVEKRFLARSSHYVQATAPGHRPAAESRPSDTESAPDLGAD
jgi:peptidoglycan/LPS O-acetylase OafA/YrhL